MLLAGLLAVVFAAAIERRQLPAHLVPREVAEAMHAYFGGLMRSWVERPILMRSGTGMPATVE